MWVYDLLLVLKLVIVIVYGIYIKCDIQGLMVIEIESLVNLYVVMIEKMNKKIWIYQLIKERVTDVLIQRRIWYLLDMWAITPSFGRFLAYLLPAVFVSVSTGFIEPYLMWEVGFSRGMFRGVFSTSTVAGVYEALGKHYRDKKENKGA